MSGHIDRLFLKAMVINFNKWVMKGRDYVRLNVGQSKDSPDLKTILIQGAYKLSEDFTKPYFHKY